MIEIGRETVADVRRWTKEAFYCWQRNCICDGCYNKKILETECRMRKTVIALVRVFGLPQTRNGEFVFSWGDENED